MNTHSRSPFRLSATLITSILSVELRARAQVGLVYIQSLCSLASCYASSFHCITHIVPRFFRKSGKVVTVKIGNEVPSTSTKVQSSITCRYGDTTLGMWDIMGTHRRTECQQQLINKRISAIFHILANMCKIVMQKPKTS